MRGPWTGPSGAVLFIFRFLREREIAKCRFIRALRNSVDRMPIGRLSAERKRGILRDAKRRRVRRDASVSGIFLDEEIFHVALIVVT